MVSQLGSLYSLQLLEHFSMVGIQATSIWSPQINLVKQDLFPFLHLRNQGAEKLRVAKLMVKPRTSVIYSSVSSCCATTSGQMWCWNSFPWQLSANKGIMTQVHRLFFSLKALDCFLLQLSQRESYLINTYVLSPWYLQPTVQLLSLAPVHTLFPFSGACMRYVNLKRARWLQLRPHGIEAQKTMKQNARRILYQQENKINKVGYKIFRIHTDS